MKKPPLVEVKWRDAFLRSSSANLADALKDEEHAIRYTIGWLIVADERVVRVSMTFDPGAAGEDPEYDDRYTIPRPYVEAIRYIERGPKRAKKGKADATPETA